MALAASLFGVDFAIGRAASALLVDLPFSRTQELEADYYGLMIMSQACFNPERAKTLWLAMLREKNSRAALDFLATHPNHEKRIKALDKEMPKAKAVFDQNCGPTSEHFRAFRGLFD